MNAGSKSTNEFLDDLLTEVDAKGLAIAACFEEILKQCRMPEERDCIWEAQRKLKASLDECRGAVVWIQERMKSV